MSVLPQLSVEYRKKYALRIDDEMEALLDPSQFSLFKEGEGKKVAWKWIDLPMKSQDKSVNKLVIHNKTNEAMTISIVLKYDLISNSESPLVYYSPSREALVAYDGIGYRLFGGICESGGGHMISTDIIDLHNWSGGTFKFQPLTKESLGWGIEFLIKLGKNGSSYLYEWEFTGRKLHELEDLHSQYQELLGRQKFTL